MTLFRQLISKLGLNRALMFLLAIATSLLLFIGIPLANQARAQLKPFTGRPAPKLPTLDRIISLVDKDRDRLVTIFKDIHQNAELGFMETRTAGIVAKELKALGYEVKTGIGKTGVVGILRNGDGPKVMYRADMDANAVAEKTGLPYASTKRVERNGEEVPVMHACGHDAHTTWMLGVAKTMVALKSEWKGTLILVGQPDEEGGNGATAMMKDGLYTQKGVPLPDYLIAMHTAPGPTGLVANAEGTRMAGFDQLDVVFKGVGGHGSSPHVTKDPIVMTAHAITQYQTIVARAIDPQETAVITVGAVQAGIDNNVIPGESLLKLNLRWFNPGVRETMLKGIGSINNAIARSYGMPENQLPSLTMKGGAPPLVNDKELVDRMSAQLVNFVGQKGLLATFPATTGSEDVQLLMGDNKNIKLDFAFVGVADPALFAKAQAEGLLVPFSNHNANFQVDLNAIPFGTKVGSVMAMELLGSAK
ncbi:MAG: amidohydrolase [Cyanosarcina radialis HA8281-LM2]|jgi:hippurate hydrolase|nr:amidohydrolase [Cyanosarcina radialis HA8281-LM2]